MPYIPVTVRFQCPFGAEVEGGGLFEDCEAEITATIEPGVKGTRSEPGEGPGVAEMSGCFHAAAWSVCALGIREIIRLEAAALDAAIEADERAWEREWQSRLDRIRGK